MTQDDAGAVTGTSWRTGRPPQHGYYLGAWKRGSLWTVSELWFNPDATGTGWFTSREYLRQNDRGHETVPVEAWMPMPVYEPELAARPVYPHAL